MGWRSGLVVAVFLLIGLYALGCGGGGEAHDLALVGAWSMYAMSVDGVPLSELPEKTLLTVEADGTYRVDNDDSVEVFWQTGNWHTSGTSLTANCTAASDAADIGTSREFVYSVAGGVLTLDGEEEIEGAMHDVTTRLRLLDNDASLVGEWLQISLTVDGTPVSPVPGFVLDVDADGTYTSTGDEEGGGSVESGDWGTYHDPTDTLVAISRSASSASDIGRQHIAQYSVSGDTLTLAYRDFEGAVEHDYVAVFARLSLDASLVGRWSQSALTMDAAPVTPVPGFLLAPNADGTFRVDNHDDADIGWETGAWATAGSTLVAVVADASSATDIGRVHVAEYSLSGDTLTLTWIEDAAVAPVTVVSTLERLGLDSALVAVWDQTGREVDGVPDVMTWTMRLTVSSDATYGVVYTEGAITSTETGDWGTYDGTLVAIARTSTTPADVGRQHIAAYDVSGDTLTMTYTEYDGGVPQAIVDTYERVP